MNIQTSIGVDRYNLHICHGSGNFYRLSIAEGEIVVHSFEGIYPNLQTAIERGRSIIQNLGYLKQNSTSRPESVEN